MAGRIWVPSAIERRCLEHLDRAENWRMLGRERPPESSILPWRPFRPIFLFNLAQYGVVLALLFVGVKVASGTGASGLREDAPYGLPGIVSFATILAGYTAHIYRRSWNRRARALSGS